MNTDILIGDWKQLKGNVKEWWGKVTDNDLLLIDGKVDKLLGVLQERYGWDKEQAIYEINKRLSKNSTPKKGSDI